jgi:hypothetical protein
METSPVVAARISQLVAYLATCTILGLLAVCGGAATTAGTSGGGGAWPARAARVAALYAPQVLARMIGGAAPETGLAKLQPFVDKEIIDLGGTVPP